ncbi:BON domain-containing protein [Magnetovibrio sp. PR-2]|uniref:BON domain-containing protein n=1 Tax=Magnetovibrio sp. PR-2 TaxID=3120356 RepID=UPI002FCE637A
MRTLILSTALVASLSVAASAQAIEFNPLSYVKGAVEAVVEDRSTGDIAKDAEIKTKMTAAIIDGMGSDVLSVNIDAYEQVIMLTGIVETADLKAQATNIARNVEGVKKLYNEMLVIPKVEQDKGMVEGLVDDTVVETKINAQLLDAKGVNVTNFRWRSLHGNVFLFGRALSAAELTKAVGVVKDIEGVKHVTNRVMVKPKG